MKRKRIFLLALLSGIVTTGLFFVLINQTASSSDVVEEAVETVSVVVAAEDIKKDQHITEEQVALKEMPKDQVHPEAIQELTDVVNAYSDSEIKSGEVILHHRIQEQEEEKDVVSRKIQEGYRAVSVQVDYVTGISNLLQPEDMVDVVLSTINPMKTEIILERVRVLAVGERLVEEKEDGTEVQYQAVTLEMKQADTVKVVDASVRAAEGGKLQLALYSKYDPLEETAKVEKSDVITEKMEVITIPYESNIRTAPDLTASVLTVVKKDTPLVVLQEKKTKKITWYEVETPDQQKGWISNRIVQQKEN
ncbi:Flp pilus assembly protein CpaB [Oceanobacillus halotolerans]|uniref:Flp pilus assembly protein CpaB n=1 Tax=Oceanobacillus halotolerans TaxID=2663380 RepID=UPI0013DCB1BF|nr:Flp pilus assembly protein CpaB [Oceanobacillus halotolerans]